MQSVCSFEYKCFKNMPSSNSIINWPHFSTFKHNSIFKLFVCWCCALYNILGILPDTLLAVFGPISYPLLCRLHLIMKNILSIHFIGQVFTFKTSLFFITNSWENKLECLSLAIFFRLFRERVGPKFWSRALHFPPILWS